MTKDIRDMTIKEGYGLGFDFTVEPSCLIDMRSAERCKEHPQTVEEMYRQLYPEGNISTFQIVCKYSVEKEKLVFCYSHQCGFSGDQQCGKKSCPHC